MTQSPVETKSEATAYTCGMSAAKQSEGATASIHVNKDVLPLS